MSEANQNAIRPTAIGKKNWLFIGGADASQRGAILYSIVEPQRSEDSSHAAGPEGQTKVRQSCRRHGIDPYAYLGAVSTRLRR